MRSRRPWCFSHLTTAATSRERNCLWTAVSHKCRPLRAEGHGIKTCSSAPPFLVPAAWNLPEKMFRTNGVVQIRSETRNQLGETVQVLAVKLVVPRRPDVGQNGNATKKANAAQNPGH